MAACELHGDALPPSRGRPQADVPAFGRTRDVLRRALAGRVFPGAVVEVGGSRRPVWREAFGWLSYDLEALATHESAIFDLASLTKVVATTTLVMGLVDLGRLRVEDPIARWLPDWRRAGREHVTVGDLLEHASGLPSWLPLYCDYAGRAEFERAICNQPLDYEPRTRSIYSDLGFMLLGFILEDLESCSLSAQFARLRQRLELGEITFNPPAEWRPRTAPTEVDPWRGRVLVGEVHDENAWALGGVAGHSGLFGSVAAVGRFARLVLQARLGEATACAALAQQQTMLRFTTRGAMAGSSRALGWDTMLPTSSCGSKMSGNAFGHTGFTGTSLWLDPAADLYVVVLTNRVHPTRANESIHDFRPLLHNAVMDDLAR
jgi:CubicO group peptidase (beta-lactamase class C family)